MNTRYKRFLTLAMALMSAIVTFAHDVEVDGICYNLNHETKEASVTFNGNKNKTKGYENNITIPTNITIDNELYKVTSIGEEAFSHCKNLTSITIPNSVTSIDEGAFFYCQNLISINVDKGNKIYDSRNDCNAIIHTATNKLVMGCKKTIIPNTVTCIGRCAFEHCHGLTSITIPNSVTKFEHAAFKGCVGLTSITIPNRMKSIGEFAFEYCFGLTSVIIPNSVESIEDNAFFCCEELSSITLPNSTKHIKESAFAGCI